MVRLGVRRPDESAEKLLLDVWLDESADRPLLDIWLNQLTNNLFFCKNIRGLLSIVAI